MVVKERSSSKISEVYRMRAIFNRIRSDGWLWIAILLAVAGALAIAFLPWETAGAPVLIILLAGGAAAGWMVGDSPVEERRFVIRLFLVALGVRLLTTVLFYWAIAGNPQYLFKDAIGYDRLAWIIAQAWHNHGILPEPLGLLGRLQNEVYPLGLSGLYYVIGRSPGAAIAFNAVLGAASVYLVYRISAILFGAVPARWAGWLTAFYTGFWLWGIMVLKDTLFLFFTMLFFLGMYRLWYLLIQANSFHARIRRAAGWVIVMILTLAGANALRGYAGPALAGAAVVLLMVWFLKPGGIGRWLLVLTVGAICIAIVWPKVIPYSLPPIAVTDQSLLFQAVEVPETGTLPVFLKWIFDHPLSFGFYLLLSAVSTTLAPFAWILPGTLPGVTGFAPSMIAFPGLWLWYALIPFTILGVIPAIRRTRGDVWPMVIFGAGLFLVFSIFIPREFRHRDMIMPIALMLAAEGLVFSRRWWFLGLFFWIPLVGFIAWKLHSLVPILLTAALVAIAGIGYWIHWRRPRKGSILNEET
jgi:hypothetical protein